MPGVYHHLGIQVKIAADTCSAQCDPNTILNALCVLTDLIPVTTLRVETLFHVILLMKPKRWEVNDFPKVTELVFGQVRVLTPAVFKAMNKTWLLRPYPFHQVQPREQMANDILPFEG